MLNLILSCDSISEKRGRKMNKRRKIFIIIMAIVIAIIVVIVGGFTYYNVNLQAVSKNSETVDVTIAEGMNVSKIINLLNKNGLIKNTNVFKLYVKINKVSNIQAGEYELNKNMDAKAIINKLKEAYNNEVGNLKE